MAGDLILMLADGERIATTLEAFLGDNEFSAQDAARIAVDIDRLGICIGGGGAQPLWALTTPEAYVRAAAQVADPAVAA